MAITDVIRCPDWVTTGTIPTSQAEVIVEAMDEIEACAIVEIGTASGYSAAVFAGHLDRTGRDWRLDTVDYGEKCYFDSSKRVGQCIDELLDDTSRIFVHRSSTSLDFSRILGDRPVDFAYIDGSHSSPWAAIDLLGLLPNLVDEAVIAIDDILLPFQEGYSRQNASRDLFRAWRGPKWVDPRAPNLGLMRISDKAQAAGDAATVLLSDWDEPLSQTDLGGLGRLLNRLADIDYRSKRELQEFIHETRTSISNPNRYLQISGNPFAGESILHPNDGSDAPTIRWHGLPGAAGRTIQIAARARNDAPENPGARLTIRLFNDAGTAISSTDLDLPPRRTVFTEHMACPSVPFSVEIEVHKNKDQAAFAGIELHRFTLSS